MDTFHAVVENLNATSKQTELLNIPLMLSFIWCSTNRNLLTETLIKHANS